MTFQTAQETPKVEVSTPQTPAYEAPAIESVLTAELLEREVHYAGNVTVSNVKPT